MACSACLVCFISTVNGHCNKKRKEKKKLTLGRLALVAGTQQTLSNLFWDFQYICIKQSLDVYDLSIHPRYLKIQGKKKKIVESKIFGGKIWHHWFDIPLIKVVKTGVQDKSKFITEEFFETS